MVQEGDLNTKFFHATVNQQRKRAFIHKIHNSNGDWLSNSNGIANAGVYHFQTQFTRDTYVGDFPLIVEHISTCITAEMDDQLTIIPSEEEIFRAVNYMNANGAAGLDGFNGQKLAGGLLKLIW